jgi:hypothetical protein
VEVIVDNTGSIPVSTAKLTIFTYIYINIGKVEATLIE